MLMPKNSCGINYRLRDEHGIDTEATIPDLDVDRFLNDWQYRNVIAQEANAKRPFGDVDDVPSHRYTCYANLGTALIHQALKPAFAGDRSAMSTLSEGREYILKAIAHHPGCPRAPRSLANARSDGIAG